MEAIIQINERDKASVMNMLNAMGFKPTEKIKINTTFNIHLNISLRYADLTEEQVEVIKDKLMKCNKENKITTTKS